MCKHDALMFDFMVYNEKHSPLKNVYFKPYAFEYKIYNISQYNLLENECVI